MTKRTSTRQRKPRDISPDQTLTPSKRSSRLSTRRKKEETESESESEEVPVEVKTPSRRGRTSRKPEKKVEETEDKEEDDDKDTSDESTKHSNGVAKPPSSARRTRHSSRSEDNVETDKKSRGCKHKYQHEDKLEEEEEANEQPTEEKEEQETAPQVPGQQEEDNQEEQLAEQSPEPEKPDESIKESAKQGVEEEGEEQMEMGSPVREEASSSEEEGQGGDGEEEGAEPPARSSTVVSVTQEEQEEDESAATENVQDRDSDDKGDEDGEETVADDGAIEREEGEIEGSPPPVWSGEQRTWGVSKPNSKIKFFRSRDPAISTSVLKELNMVVKPLPRDVLESARTDTSHIAPISYSSEEEEEDAPNEGHQEDVEVGEEEKREVEDENENPNKKRRREEEADKKKEEETEKKKSPGTVRKVSIKKDRKDVSPRRAHRPTPAPLTPTPVLYIYNLTRPFTLGQLRELLSRTGKIVPDGFWINAIKSKCYVEYENEEQAEETRHALHEVRWPVTNDKVLKVEFTTKDAMLSAQIKAETQEMPTQRKTEPLVMDRNSQRVSVREWDMGKVAEDEDKSRDADRRDRKRKDRHRSESGEPDVRRRKRDIEAPAKLLDDLFRKTKTLPCLYWLPLTAEQIAVKEEMRKKHLAELEKRMKSSRSSRDRRSRRS
ncbi:hypothetical protein M8J75_013402 [Diaphorina citri]|nr:hypothetical protein M8J75_013402 [Diaphorina citri]